MPRLATLILLQLTTISTTKPYITFYWKTTAATDKYFDYWNHGPIFIPGLEDVYTLTTKAADIFPPWLTRDATTLGTTTILDKKTTKPTSTFPSTTITTTTTTTAPVTKKGTTPAKKPKPVKIETTEAKPTTTTEINTTHRPKLVKQFSVEEAENLGPTDPFSVFLRKFLRTLSVKGHSELPPLFSPFSSYMTELITDRDLNQLGDIVLTYAKDMIKELDGMILTPDKLRTLCYQAYIMLSNRHTALEEDINNLLDFLDDMYNEDEEEVMQIVLREATRFPNTNTTAEEIAYGFVNNVILLPMNRMNGTSKCDSLVKMLTAAVLKRSTSSRRHLGNTRGGKRSHSDLRDNIIVKKSIKRFTKNKYKSIRDNIDNIDSLLHKLGLSSLDTSADEYEQSEDDDTDNIKVKQVKKITKKTNNHPINIFKTNSDDDGESLLENDDYNKNMEYGQMDKVTPNIKSIFDNLGKSISVTDKSSIVPKENSIHFRFGNVQKYLNNEHTVLVPGHSMTKLIKKRIQYDSVTKKHKTSRYDYFTDDRPKPITYNIKSIFDNLGKSISVTDKSSVIPKESSIHFRFGNVQKYLNSEHTVLVPGHSMTKLVKKRIQYDSVTKKHKTSRYDYFTDDRPKPITKLNTQQFPKLPKSQIKKETDAELKLITDLNNLASSNLLQHQFKNKALASMLLKRKPFYLDINKGLETLQPLQVTALKPLSNQITKHTPKTRITIKMVKTVRSKIQNKQKQVKNIEHNLKEDHVKEENADESDDSDTYSETSSETFGHKPSIDRKRKYKKLKRKYNILKRLSAQILAQNMDKIKQEQTSPDAHTEISEIADNNKVSEDKNKFYNTVQETTGNEDKKIKINNINLFLNDYDGEIEFVSDSQETLPMANKLVDYNNIRKSFPLSKTTDNSVNVTAIDYSDAEIELKRNIYDAIRHMDFINYNASRRSEDVKSIVGQESHETDVEAVLKTNIYKAVKKLLKT